MAPGNFEGFIDALITNQIPQPAGLDLVFDWLEINSVLIDATIAAHIGRFIGTEPVEKTVLP